MPINIPESVFTKYYDIIDSTINDIFGIDCELVFIEKIEEISNTFDNIPHNKSINAHRRRSDNYKRGNKTIKEVEKRETVKLKVYWDSKNWVKVGGGIVVPDNSIQTIFFASDLDKVMRAKFLHVHKNISELRDYKFTKFGEPFPMGLRQNRYFGCFWQRAQ
tara:strand:- start:173 stop:658 length:486 start_codon:yes stop_codon:yes gene_type:complete